MAINKKKSTMDRRYIVGCMVLACFGAVLAYVNLMISMPVLERERYSRGKVIDKPLDLRSKNKKKYTTLLMGGLFPMHPEEVAGISASLNGEDEGGASDMDIPKILSVASLNGQFVAYMNVDPSSNQSPIFVDEVLPSGWRVISISMNKVVLTKDSEELELAVFSYLSSEFH